MAKKQVGLKKHSSYLFVGIAKEKLEPGDMVEIDPQTGMLIKARPNRGKSKHGLRKRNQVTKGKG